MVVTSFTVSSPFIYSIVLSADLRYLNVSFFCQQVNATHPSAHVTKGITATKKKDHSEVNKNVSSYEAGSTFRLQVSVAR